MKKIVMSVLGILTFCTVWCEELPWKPYSQAVKISQKEKKPVFIFFTGSDWCKWCMIFNKEVLSQKSFQKYVKDKFVFYKADFPQSIEIPPAEEKLNMYLSRKYKVDGYPTVVIVNPEGIAIGTIGYQEGGPDFYIEQLKRILSQRR